MSKITNEMCKDSLKEFLKNSTQIDDIVSKLIDELCRIEQLINYYDDLYDKKEVELKFYRNLRKEFYKDE